MDEFTKKKSPSSHQPSTPKALCVSADGDDDRSDAGQALSSLASLATSKPPNPITPNPSIKSSVCVNHSSNKQSEFASPPSWLMDSTEEGRLKRQRKEAQDAESDKVLSESRVWILNEIYKQRPKLSKNQMVQLKSTTTTTNKDSVAPKMEDLVKMLKNAPNINLPYASAAQYLDDSTDSFEDFFKDFVPPPLDDVLSLGDALLCSSLPEVSFTPDPVDQPKKPQVAPTLAEYKIKIRNMYAEYNCLANRYKFEQQLANNDAKVISNSSSERPMISLSNAEKARLKYLKEKFEVFVKKIAIIRNQSTQKKLVGQ